MHRFEECATMKMFLNVNKNKTAKQTLALWDFMLNIRVGEDFSFLQLLYCSHSSEPQQ